MSTSTDVHAPERKGPLTFQDELTAKDGFVRTVSGYRNMISPAQDSAFPIEQNRYHLYVSHGCPWATRLVVMRALKGLEDFISICYVDVSFNPIYEGDVALPHWQRKLGWVFSEEFPDKLYQKKTLREVYLLGDADHDSFSKSTTPLLWDKKTRRAVNNESTDILLMFNSILNSVATHPEVDVCPPQLQAETKFHSDKMYESLNNGVYKCGFATSQELYERFLTELYVTLDYYEEWLATRRFILGAQFTEADLRLWMTLVRFDPVYFIHFKVSRKRLTPDYPNLANYVRDIWQLPNIGANIDMRRTQTHYFTSHPINPSQLVPFFDTSTYELPHGRANLSTQEQPLFHTFGPN